MTNDYERLLYRGAVLGDEETPVNKKPAPCLPAVSCVGSGGLKISQCNWAE